MFTSHDPDKLFSLSRCCVAMALLAGLATSAYGQAVYQINCGGAAASPFVADEFFTGGGTIYNTSASIDTTGVTNPAPQAVYQWSRGDYPLGGQNGGLGGFSYTLPNLTPNAAYTVRLHLASIEAGATPGTLTFDIAVNGTTVRSYYDIAAAAGGPPDSNGHVGLNKAVVVAVNAKAVKDKADAKGHLSIVFTVDQAFAQCNGIEILTGNSAVTKAPGIKSITYSANQTTVSWGAVTGAKSYNILRSSAASGPYVRIDNNPLTNPPVTGTTYTDPVSGGYYYQVVAVNDAGEGPPSPAAPYLLTANPSSLTISRGSSAALTLNAATPQPASLALTVSGVPSGVSTACFPSVLTTAYPYTSPPLSVESNPPLQVDIANSVLTLFVGQNAATGSYTLKITGKIGTYTQAITVPLTIQ